MPGIRIGIAVGFDRGGGDIVSGPALPTGLTLSLISGGVKIDWTDNSGGTAETEIWGQSDGAASALLYTINAGIVTKSETLNPVDLRYYKIRAKNGVNFSAFTAEASIAMLGPELIPDPTFDSGWTAGGLGFAIGGGVATYTNNGTSYAQSNFQAVLNDHYRVRFTTTPAEAVPRVAMWDGAGWTIFTTPWHLYTMITIATGTLTYYLTCSRANNGVIRFTATSASSSFILDNFSIKKILAP